MGASFVEVQPTWWAIGEATIFMWLALELAADAKDEYDRTTDLLENTNLRRLAMARRLQDHQINVTHAFLKYAMDEAFEYPVHEPDYGGICSFFHNEMGESLSKANAAHDHYTKLFCMEPSECKNDLGFYAGIAAVDSAFHRGRQQEARKLTNLQDKVAAIHQAHAGTFRSPSAIFGLLENAAQIYGYLQQQAFSNYAGSLSTFSYGLKGLVGAFTNPGGGSA